MSQPRILFVVGAYPDVGKGVFSSALGYLLQELGHSVGILKYDGHFNTSTASIARYHDTSSSGAYYGEEIFVTADGYLSHLDFGNYEKFLHRELTNRHNVTMGRLFQWVLDAEREGTLPSKSVNYRHMRNWLAEWILEVATDDILIVECGGTVGDREVELLFEAVSQIRDTDAARVQTILISPYMWKETEGAFVSYRSKMTRAAFERSWRLGVRPNMVVLRMEKGSTLIDSDIGYIGGESGLNPETDVFTNPDRDNLYALPSALHEQGLDRRVLDGFGLKTRGSKSGRLETYSKGLEELARAEQKVRIGLFPDGATFDSLLSLFNAFENAAVATGVATEIVRLDGTEGSPDSFDDLDAVVLGEGLSEIDRRCELLRTARERELPCLALAFGFDLFVKEYARAILGQSVALEELEEDGKLSFSRIELRTGGVPMSFEDDSIRCPASYHERVRTNSTQNGALREMIQSSDLAVLAVAEADGEPMALRVPDHPFCVAAKYHPEYLSHPGHPHPLFVQLLEAAARRAGSR